MPDGAQQQLFVDTVPFLGLFSELLHLEGDDVLVPAERQKLLTLDAYCPARTEEMPWVQGMMPVLPGRCLLHVPNTRKTQACEGKGEWGNRNLCGQ